MVQSVNLWVRIVLHLRCRLLKDFVLPFLMGRVNYYGQGKQIQHFKSAVAPAYLLFSAIERHHVATGTLAPERGYPNVQANSFSIFKVTPRRSAGFIISFGYPGISLIENVPICVWFVFFCIVLLLALQINQWYCSRSRRIKGWARCRYM